MNLITRDMSTCTLLMIFLSCFLLSVEGIIIEMKVRFKEDTHNKTTAKENHEFMLMQAHKVKSF